MSLPKPLVMSDTEEEELYSELSNLDEHLTDFRFYFTQFKVAATEENRKKIEAVLVNVIRSYHYFYPKASAAIKQQEGKK